MQVGLMDFGRMARTARVMADMVSPLSDAAVAGADTAAAGPVLTGVEKIAFTKATTQFSELVAEQRELVQAGGIGQAREAVAVLDHLQAQVDGTLDAIRGIPVHTPVVHRGKVSEVRSSYDLSVAATPLRDTAAALELAHAQLLKLDGVYQITPEGSSVMRLGDAALDHARRQPLPARQGPPTLDQASIDRYVTGFRPRTQRILTGLYRVLVAPFVRPQHVDLHHVRSAMGTGRPMVATSTHMSQSDAPALLHTVAKGGGPALRPISADHVFIPKLKWVMGKAGLIGRSTQWDGGKVSGRELLTESLRQGQSIAIFPEGTLYPFLRGAVGEPIEGSVRMASETGALIVPTASSGYQNARILGQFAAGRRPVTVVGEPMVALAPASGSTELQRAHQLFEQREVQAQVTERLAGRAWQRYAGQRG